MDKLSLKGKKGVEIYQTNYVKNQVPT